MSLKNLQESSNVEKDKDSVGGTSFVVESGAEEYEIELAYIGKSQSGATSLTLHLKRDGAMVRQTLWVTSGDAKGNKTSYTDAKGKEHNLPGFSIANGLCLLTVGKPLAEMDTEEKVVKLYDFDAGKEMPVAVEALTELHGQHVIAGVIKQIVDKTKKNDATGQYEPTGETREENEIDKFFRAKDGLTKTEIEGGVTEPTFLNTWKAKWTGVTRNKAKGASASGAVAGAPVAAKPTTSLFK